jgi:hypothetical protein
MSPTDVAQVESEQPDWELLKNPDATQNPLSPKPPSPTLPNPQSMKTTARLLLPLLLILGLAAHVNAAPLTNADVIKMASSGVEDSVIITAVENAADNGLDASTGGLIALSKASVSQNVIAAVIKRAAVKTPPAAVPTPVPAPAPAPSPAAGTTVNVRTPYGAVATSSGGGGGTAVNVRAPFVSVAVGAGAVKSLALAYDPALPDTTIRSVIHSAALDRGWSVVGDSLGCVQLEYKGYPSTIYYGQGAMAIGDSGRHRRTATWAKAMRESIQEELKKLNEKSDTPAPAPEKQ